MFTIGDFARHGRVSVRMLRHYDALGLLRPALVDPFTGYRSYEAAQLARLNRVIALKDLGFTLQQVGEILDDKVGAEELRAMLRLRRAELAAARAAAEARLAQVEARLRSIESEGRMSTHDVVVKRIPAVRVAWLSAVAEGFEPEAVGPVVGPLFDELCRRLAEAGVEPTGPAVALYEDHPRASVADRAAAAGAEGAEGADGADGSGSGAVLVHAALPVPASATAAAAAAGGFEIVELPAVEAAATVVHRGSMDDVLPTAQTLAAWIDANGYRSRGYARELYLECPEDRGGWVTELQEPVEGPPAPAAR
ncbi:MerR family transcriptional regulator [Streptomyces sp. NRRL S-87]|uniref:MerR family transcriptional regulator n=1 Tax=Streptomyces sp. NRRL S-87 TaxID=1463920 RepID=UPI0004BE7852|nr:MerR family transcriptional regulator [Streptomyces sp. NRRL S-87]